MQNMPNTPTPENLLLAAKRSGINDLKQLQNNSALVIRVSTLIHELQRERGISNTFLASNGQRFVQERTAEVEATNAALHQFREELGQRDLAAQTSGSSRLLNSLAYAMHSLDELPDLRTQIAARQMTAVDNTWHFNRLIAGLLNVVFEAADLAGDPDITRALVALFNFIQGKEYAGQERAWGVIGFTGGDFSAELQDRIHNLQDAQQRCFDIFSRFTSALGAEHWRQLESSEAAQELGRLRKMIERFRRGDSLPTAFGEVWYGVTTSRIDAMQEVEQLLTAALPELCNTRILKAEDDLRQHQTQLTSAASFEAPPISPLSTPNSSDQQHSAIAPGFNVKLARSVFELVQDQAERLQKISEELAEARQALDERKLIEKAKGLLMQSQGINEEQAYRQIRQAAMDGKKRIVEIAANIISVSDMLSLGRRS